MKIILRDKDSHGQPTAIITTKTSTADDIENAIYKMKSEVEDYDQDDISDYLPEDAEIEFLSVPNGYEVWW